jgi:DNA-binding CsgD family transcriptional regulator
MGQPPDQPPREKGLSAHQAGLPVRHGKTSYDLDAVLPERPGGLTVREEEVALLLAEDLTNAEISQKTGAAIATVKTHVHKILGKIKGRTRTSAIVWVWRRRVEMRDREILMLKEALAKQGSSAASKPRPD